LADTGRIDKQMIRQPAKNGQHDRRDETQWIIPIAQRDPKDGDIGKMTVGIIVGSMSLLALNGHPSRACNRCKIASAFRSLAHHRYAGPLPK
jgi:hypothetical protein